MKRQVEYDYVHQAWIVNGRYHDCAHANHVECNCYGRAHRGETARIECLEYIDADLDQIIETMTTPLR